MSKTTVPTLRHCRGLNVNRIDATQTHALHALQALRKMGVSILSQRSNGRRLVVVVDQPPASVSGGMCRRQPMADGRTHYTLAAPWRGLQLEWAAYSCEVRHG